MQIFSKKIKITPQFYENEAWAKDRIVYGIDEVGRGCLAGPVVTAAVILKPYINHKLLKDSKLLNRKELLEVYYWLLENSEFSVSFTNHYQIDKLNIYKATQIAMKRAVYQLYSKTGITPIYILTDNMPIVINNIDTEIKSFAKGESLSSSIAAASIIAKITRDALIDRIDKLVPGYNFINNKGYGTNEHQDSLKEAGVSIIHRKTFLDFLDNSNNSILKENNGKQISIC